MTQRPDGSVVSALQAQSLGNYWVMDMPVNADELLLQQLMQVSAAAR